MQVDGICALHAIVSDACRSHHGDEGAFDEATRQLKEQYNGILSKRRDEPGIKYHLLLTVEDTKRKK